VERSNLHPFSRLVQANPVASVILSLADRRVVEVNQPFVALSGFSRAEAVGRTIEQLGLVSNPGDSDMMAETWRTGAPTGDLSLSLRPTSGPARAVSASVVPVDLDGAPHAIVHLVDVTDHSIAETRLREAESRYRAVVEAQTDLVCRFLPDTTLTFVNGAYCRFFGKPRGELVGTSFLALLPEESRAAVRERISSQVGHPRRETYEHDVLLPDGTVGRQQWTDQPILDDEGRLVELQAIGRDVTDQRRAEAAVRASEARFRSLIANATDLVTLLDPDGTIRYESPAISRILGHDPEALVGQRAFDLVHPDDRSLIRDAFGALVADATLRPTVEFRFRHADGSWRWLEATGTNLLADPAVGGVVVNSRDVTERRAAAAALDRERALIQALLDSTPDMVYVKDTASRFLRINPAAAAWYGLADPAAAIGRTDHDIFPRAIADPLLAEERRLLAGQVAEINRLEHYPDRGDGGVWLLAIKVPVRDADGAIVGLAGISRDVTAMKRSEQEVLAAKEAAEAASRAKSRFLANMSHELRTPLNAVLGYAHLLLDGLDGPLSPEQEADVRRIVAGADRLLALVDDVLDVARIEAGRLPLAVESVELAPLVEAVRDELGAQAAAKGLALVVDVPAGLRVEGDPVRLRQVLRNLAANAVKFTETGQVTISARAEGDRVAVSVADTGIGLAPEAIPAIFEPFRQADAGTNRRYGGSGLGLTIVSRLIDLHRGAIAVESLPGAGSTFTVTLPARGEPLARAVGP